MKEQLKPTSKDKLVHVVEKFKLFVGATLTMILFSSGALNEMIDAE